MNASTSTMTSHQGTYNAPAFWERLWRMSGLGFVFFLVAAYFLHGSWPLIAAILSGMALLNLLWFVAALRTTLADAGKDGWGAAATASSAAFGALFFVLAALSTSGSSDLAWSTFVLSSFPRAMLIMSGTFGLWRAGLISNALFGAGVGVVVLVLLGGTTWLSAGIWAPDGLYSQFVSPVVSLAWVLAVSVILLIRAPATRTGW